MNYDDSIHFSYTPKPISYTEMNITTVAPYTWVIQQNEHI